MAVNEWVPTDTDDYTVGKITLTAGSSDIVFADAFNGAESSFYAGDSIYVPTSGKWLLLASITSKTAGTLIYPCPADCAGTFDLRLRPLSRNARQAGLAAMVLRNLQVGNLPSLAEVTAKQGQMIVAGVIPNTFVAQDIPKIPEAPDLTKYMDKATYDKNDKKVDVYDMGNMVENVTANNNVGALMLTNAERKAISENKNNIKKISDGATINVWKAGSSSTNIGLSPSILKSLGLVGNRDPYLSATTIDVPFLASGGLFIQAGRVAGGDVNVVFRTAFPNTCIAVVAGFSALPSVAGTILTSISLANLTNTGFTLNPRWSNGAAVGVQNTAQTYIAIGY